MLLLPRLTTGDRNIRIEVLEELEKLALPHNKGQILKASADSRSMTLGFYSHPAACGLTKATAEYPALVHLVAQLAAAEIPGVGFTSVTVNHNLKAHQHVDRNNGCLTMMLCLGAYAGGEVRIAGVGDLDPNNKWVPFDANCTHETLPFAGERYALLFYTNVNYLSTDLRVQRAVRKLGFGRHVSCGMYATESISTLQRRLHFLAEDIQALKRRRVEEGDQSSPKRLRPDEESPASQVSK